MTDDGETVNPERSGAGIYTETLGRLYWRQGFLSKALDIYRHLAQAQPENRHLRDQVIELTQQLSAAVLDDAGQRPDAAVTVSGAGVTPHDLRGTERLIAYLERWLHQLRQQRASCQIPGES